MRVLILGGTGLISTAITRSLAHNGHDLTIFNRSTSHGFGSSVALFTGDRNNPDDMQAAADQGPFDVVLDMICFTPAQAEVAIRAFRKGVTQYVLCSTVDVFTKRGAIYPLNELAERRPSPSFSYAFDKAQCEFAFEKAAETGAFGLTILRPGATYLNSAVAPIGTYQLYVERLRAGLPIILHGDGSSIWVSAHRDDVALAFVNAIGNARTIGRSYNITGSELLTWDVYWSTVAQALGVGYADILHIPTDALRTMAPQSTEWCVENFSFNNIFDNAAAMADLDFRYATTWAEGTSAFTFSFESPVPVETAREFDAIVLSWRAAELAAEASAKALNS